MKTTIDIPDSLYPQIASASAAAGQTIEAFVVSVVAEHTGQEADSCDAPRKDRRPEEVPTDLTNAEQIEWLRANVDPGRLGLMAAFGTVDADTIAELDRFIDEEFSQIDPKDWE